MKRKYDKKEFLGAFKLDFPKLSLLVSELNEQFKGLKPILNISIVIKNEELEFNSLSELKEYIPNLPSQVKNITIYLADTSVREKIIMFTSENDITNVMARSSDEIWCAIMIQICKKYAIANKMWYSFIKSYYLYLLGFITLLLPLGFIRFLALKPINNILTITWPILIILLFNLVLLFNKLFPRFILEFRKEENIIKKYSVELTLLFTILAFIVSLLSLFL
jgi:hypothetical protein